MSNEPQSNADNDLNTKPLFKAWLEKLQQESWQLELIISGFVLYGIYSSKGLVSQLRLFNDDHNVGPFLNILEVVIAVGWKIFFINLLIHVILRSLWIGAIGLRYVSGEINYDALNYSSTFTKYLERKVGEYDDFIGRLEKICSVLFSYTFLLFLFFVSIIAFTIFLVLPMLMMEWFGFDLDKNMGYIAIWILPVLIGGLIVFIDFVTLGGLKRIKERRFSKIYMPIYWLYSHVTLSFLYRPLLYNFIDDRYTRRLFYFSFPYIFFIITFDKMFTHNETVYRYDEDFHKHGLMVDPYYYDDLYDDAISLQSRISDEVVYPEPLKILRLSQYKVTEPYLQLFVRYNQKYDKVIKEKHGINPYYEKGWNFSLLDQDHRIVDSTEFALKDSFKVYERAVYEEYKIMRDSVFDVRKDSVQKTIVMYQRDSLKAMRNDLYQHRLKGIDDYRNRKMKKIHQIIKDQISLSIDNVSYNDSMTCYHSIHHLRNTEGVVYNIPVKHLDIGDHIISIEVVKNYIVKEDSLHTETYKLPILKIN